MVEVGTFSLSVVKVLSIGRDGVIEFECIESCLDLSCSREICRISRWQPCVRVWLMCGYFLLLLLHPSNVFRCIDLIMMNESRQNAFRLTNLFLNSETHNVIVAIACLVVDRCNKK